MNALHRGRLAVAVALAVAVLPRCLVTGAMAATTIARLSLDFKFEGPSAPFLLALDKGYYKTEGLDVTHRSGCRLAGVDHPRCLRQTTRWASATSMR